MMKNNFFIVAQYSAYIEADSNNDAKQRIIDDVTSGRITIRDFEITAEEDKEVNSCETATT
jgi:hypothetical protein